MSAYTKPLPTIDALNAEYWAGTKLGELRVQRCLDCGTLAFPPSRHCASCLGERSEWIRTGGRGTVITFGIFHRITPGGDGTLEDCLQPGRKLFGAGYIIYSSSTILVYSTGHGVNGFSLDPSVGEFVLSHPNITMPKRGKIYSANEGNYPYWKQGTREYIEYLKSERNTRKGPYTSRYIGSLVADFHRNLLKGGIFLYPEDTKDPKKPTGKLRILYEANPLAFIAEQAGGYASTGYEPILDIQPTGLHQRVPLIIGSRDDVLEYEQYAKRN